MSKDDRADFLIVRYLRGEATDDELAQLRELAEADSKIAARIFAQACQELELDEYYSCAACEALPLAVRKPAISWPKRIMALAASLALVAGILLFHLQRIEQINLQRTEQINGFAILSGVDSGVEVGRNHTRLPATENMEIFADDVVVLSEAGTAKIQYLGEETTLSLQPGTRLKFRRQGEGKLMRLMWGSMDATVAKQPDGHPMRIWSDSGEIEVLGTRLVLSADESFSRVDTVSGEVAFVAEKTGKKKIVKAGNFASADAQGALLSGKTTPRITGITLVFADTGEPIPGFENLAINAPDEIVVDMNKLYLGRSSRIGCRVDTEPAVVGSVLIEWRSGTTKVLDEPPYMHTLGRDKDYHTPQSELSRTGWKLAFTPFSGPDAQGIKGTPKSFHIEVVRPRARRSFPRVGDLPPGDDLPPGVLKVFNGGFEKPAIEKPYWEYVTPKGWDATDMPILRKYPYTHSGNQHFYKHRPITLGQDLWGSVKAGRTYVLTYVARSVWPNSQLVASFKVGDETVAKSATVSPGYTNKWKQLSLSFTATEEHEDQPVRIEFEALATELDAIDIQSLDKPIAAVEI